MFDRSRLRIALFTYSTQPRGGVLHALALAEGLHDLGHDVVLYALDDSDRGFVRTPRCAFVRVPVAPDRGPILPFVRARVAAYVDGWDQNTGPFDIYHAHDGISGNALATLVERGSIDAYVRTVHHIDRFDSPEMTALQDRAIASAGRCLVVSDMWRKELATGYGIAAAVVPNGVDSARFTPLPAAERTAVRAELGYGPGPLFITIGGIEARKNTREILAAFARVRARLPTARLIIAGGASVLDHSAYRRAFEADAATFGLVPGDAFVLTGVLSDPQIVALLQAAHAVVFPSLVEGFGLVVLEALACATPVITSAIPPFTEYLAPADAQLVDPHDAQALASAMLRALEPATVAATESRGPALARRFGWDASARAHLAAYRSFCASRREITHA